jgi:membrane fusion protein, multidrug efflux system
MMKRIMISAALIILMMSCKQNNTTVVSASGSEPVPVKVATAQIMKFTPSIDLSGTVFPVREANLGAALPGRVEKIYFPEGSRVRKGDLLVSLSGELYTQALTEYTTIEKDFERVTRLNEKGSITQQEYDHVKAMYDASGAKVAMMKKNAEIVAPFSGTIVEYLVQEGENYFFNLNLDPGYSTTSGILRLMDLDNLRVETEINEKDLPKVAAGQTARVTFDALGDTLLTGSVASVKPVLSALTHTATVKIDFRNIGGIVKPGMFAHVKIELGAINAVGVPLNSVYRQAGTADEYVFVAENNKVRRQKITKILTDNATVAVREIKPGEQIVVSGKEKLSNGSLVIVK